MQVHRRRSGDSSVCRGSPRPSARRPRPPSCFGAGGGDRPAGRPRGFAMVDQECNPHWQPTFSVRLRALRRSRLGRRTCRAPSTPWSPGGGEHVLGRWRLLVVSCVAMLCVGLPARAVGMAEYELKAAFLLNFVRLIEWPASAFSEDDRRCERYARDARAAGAVCAVRRPLSSRVTRGERCPERCSSQTTAW